MPLAVAFTKSETLLFMQLAVAFTKSEMPVWQRVSCLQLAMPVRQRVSCLQLAMPVLAWEHVVQLVCDKRNASMLRADLALVHCQHVSTPADAVDVHLDNHARPTCFDSALSQQGSESAMSVVCQSTIQDGATGRLGDHTCRLKWQKEL